MCCTFEESKMLNTLLYCGEAKLNELYVHVIAYQNSAESNGPNAMIIPFPTEVSMNQDNIVDTKGNEDFLKDISDATKIHTKSVRRSKEYRGFDDDILGSIADVFESGSYTVILAKNVNQIAEGLTRVSENKRPKISEEFLMGYEKQYPNQPVAVCCWNGKIEAEPLLWWYEPKDKKTVFCPTMDAHNGLAPDLNALVEVDHIISVGSALSEEAGNEVNYNNSLTDVMKQLLPKAVHGVKLTDLMQNGDCFVKTYQLTDFFFHHGHDNNSCRPLLSRGANVETIDYSIRMTGWRA